ncbi:MAG: hypothetical protein KDD25_00160 [Bdellovibrionales bacterium]|nr:hypothetical protein [Bdellovibrionales bacterium]
MRNQMTIRFWSLGIVLVTLFSYSLAEASWLSDHASRVSRALSGKGNKKESSRKKKYKNRLKKAKKACEATRKTVLLELGQDLEHLKEGREQVLSELQTMDRPDLNLEIETVESIAEVFSTKNPTYSDFLIVSYNYLKDSDLLERDEYSWLELLDFLAISMEGLDVNQENTIALFEMIFLTGGPELVDELVTFAIKPNAKGDESEKLAEMEKALMFMMASPSEKSIVLYFDTSISALEVKIREISESKCGGV